MKKIIFLLAVVFSAHSVMSQTLQYSDASCFSGSGNNREYVTVLAKGQDGYYVATNENNIGFIYKYNTENSLVWTHEWNNGSINHSISHVIEDTDGIYVVGVELIVSDVNGYADQLVIKKISLGGDSILWQATLGNGDESNQGALSVVLKNGALLIGCSSSDNTGLFSQTHGDHEGLVMVISAEDGSLIENKTIGGSGSDRVTGFFEDAGGYVATGSTNSIDYDFTSAQGDKLFITSLNNNLEVNTTLLINITEGFLKKTIQTKHERILYASVGMKNGLGYIVVTDADEIVWERTYGSPAHLFQDVIATDDGGYIAVGYAFNVLDQYENETALLVKFSSIGDTVWSQHLGVGNTGKHAEVKSIIQLSTNEYLVGGATTTELFMCESVIQYDGWFVRLNETEDVVTSMLGANSESIRIFPNPTIDGMITVSLSKDSRIRIFDSVNPYKVVFEGNLQKGETQIFLKDSPGMYFLTDDKTVVFKIILQ
jgi:hypothetical protein